MGFKLSKNIDDSIKIQCAMILKGKFDIIEGEYYPVTWGSEQSMLLIAFENINPNVNFFYVSNDGQRDFQHNRTPNQNILFFPIENLSLDEMRIYGVKVDKSKFFPTGEIISKSRLISDCILHTQRVIDFAKDNGITALKNKIISLDKIAEMSDVQLKSYLKSSGVIDSVISLDDEKKSEPSIQPVQSLENIPPPPLEDEKNNVIAEIPKYPPPSYHESAESGASNLSRKTI